MACHRVTAAVFVIWLLIPCGLPQGSSLRIFEYNRPLHVFGGIGILMLGIGAVIGAWVVKSYDASGFLPFGPALLMILLFIIGTFATFTGIILHSISQLFDRLKTKEE